MATSLSDLYGLQAMAPDESNEGDPRQRLLQALMAQRMMGQGSASAPTPTSTPTPASSPDTSPVTTTASEPSTGKLYTGEVLPPSPAREMLTRDPSAASDIHPAGFDESGMPTQFPATATKDAARQRLQLAQHPPHAIRNALIMGALGVGGTLLAARHKNSFAGAGAAQGFNAGVQQNYDRGQTNINRANEQYQFEAGQEERQRESALHERIALSQLEAQRAYRDLLIEMRQRGQDVTTRGQDIGAEKAGFNVTPGATATSTPTLTPKSVDELPEIKQAQIAAQEEHRKFTQQQELGGGLNLQKQQNFEKMYKARIMGIEAMKQLRQQAMTQSYGLGMARLEEPTSQVRSMGETAATVLPHIEELRQLIEEADKKHLIGPMKGRVSDFLAGKIGSTGDKNLDVLMGKLRASDGLINSAMLRTHFGGRGGITMYKNFVDLLDTGKATKEQLNGALDTYKSYATGYAQAGGVDLDNFNAGGSASYNPASTNFRSIAPLTATPTKPARNSLKPKGPPAGAKIRKWDEF